MREPDRPQPEDPIERALRGASASELAGAPRRDRLVNLWMSEPELAEVRFVAGLLGLDVTTYFRRLHDRAKVHVYSEAGERGRLPNSAEIERTAGLLGLSLAEYVARLHAVAGRRLLEAESGS